MCYLSAVSRVSGYESINNDVETADVSNSVPLYVPSERVHLLCVIRGTPAIVWTHEHARYRPDAIRLQNKVSLIVTRWQACSEQWRHVCSYRNLPHSPHKAKQLFALLRISYLLRGLAGSFIRVTFYNVLNEISKQSFRNQLQILMSVGGKPSGLM